MTSTRMSKTVIATLIASGLFATTAASAAQPSTMAEWKAIAGESINKAMNRSEIKSRGNKIGFAQFAVTIGRDGEIVSATQTERANSSSLNSSARRAVRRANFPELPESYDAERLTFTLNMDYLSSMPSSRKGKPQRGRVSSVVISSDSSGR